MSTLKRGSVGADVNAWLTFLISQKLYDGKIDGVFGKKADAATRAFQKRARIDIDGEVGPATVEQAVARGFASIAEKKPSDKPAASEIAVVAPNKSNKIDAANAAHLARIDPDVATRVRSLIAAAKAKGVTLQIVQGLRTFAEQDALFAQGRSKPGKRVTNARGGQSLHNYGLAVDLAPVINGKISWDPKHFAAIGGWASIAGLEWGGNWTSFKDLPHVQRTEGQNLARIQKLYREGGLAAVWQTVK